METLFFWVGGATVLGIVTLVGSLIVQMGTAAKIRTYSELQTELRETQLQLSDLADHVERKETRERVRRMRDGREAGKISEAAPQPGQPGYKDYLRKLAMSKVNGA